MRLGTMLGGRALAALNEQAAEQRRAEKRNRKEEFERNRRRAELEDAGFRPIGPKRPSSWGSE